jgi:heme-degrading monooxygenase HmoA
MFSVLFEVQPKTEQWDNYLGNAKMLRPELEQIDGFVDNIRYRSLTRQGWILSLSGWRDEKSVVRWRTQMRHHEIQEKGRSEILLECYRAYRLGRFRCCIDARRRYFANFMARSRCRGNL